MTGTVLSKQIDMVGDRNPQYDSSAKKFLANKPILARIFKGVISELSEFSHEEIEAMIEGVPEVGSVPVEPGLTNADLITGSATENSILNEGEVFFDVLTYLMIPGQKETTKVIVNVEAQKDYKPGYDPVTRSVYYAARVISSQKEREFTGSDYDKIKKVYTIWVCFNTESLRNTVTEYKITKHNLHGKMPDIERYDLLSSVFIRLGGEISEYEDSSFQKMLMTIFAGKLSPWDIKRSLSDEFGLAMSKKMEEEIYTMCNLSAGIFEQGEKHGFKQGEKHGFEQGAKHGFEQGHDQGLKQGSSRERIALIRGMIKEKEPLNKIARLFSTTPEKIDLEFFEATGEHIPE